MRGFPHEMLLGVELVTLGWNFSHQIYPEVSGSTPMSAGGNRREQMGTDGNSGWGRSGARAQCFDGLQRRRPKRRIEAGNQADNGTERRRREW
jgi:hypothetical protein